MELDYATPEKFRLTPRMIAIASVFVSFVLLYAVVCMPAMGQRGYPPINAHLQGMAWMWIAAIPLTALFEERSRWRTLSLLFYAFATAPIDTLCWPMMVPNHFELGIFVATLPFFCIFHIIIAAALEILTRIFIVVGRRIIPVRKSRIAKFVAATLLIAAALLIPEAYWQFNGWRLTREGSSRADEDWAAKRAVVYMRNDPSTDIDGATVTLGWDEKSGLFTDGDFRLGFEYAYNTRISELIAVYGKPAWGVGSNISPKMLSDLLKTGDFKEITTFPFHPTAHINVKKSPNLIIEYERGIASDSTLPTYIHEDAAYPDIFFIRDGTDTLYVIRGDGKHLAEVNRD